jgi:hypothetical protein
MFINHKDLTFLIFREKCIELLRFHAENSILCVLLQDKIFLVGEKAHKVDWVTETS